MNKNNLYIVSFAFMLMIGLISAQDHFWAFNEGRGNIAYDSGTAAGWGRDGDRDRGNDWDRDRDGGKDWDQDRDGGKDWDQDRDGGRYGDRDRDGGKDWDQDRDGGNDWDRNRDGGNYGDRDRDGGKDWDQDRDGGRYGGRDGDRDRDGGNYGGRYRGGVNAYLNNAFWRKISGGYAVGITGADNSFVTFGNQVARFGTRDFTVAFWVQTREKSELFDLIGNRDTEDLGNFFNVRMDRDGSVTAEISQDGRGTNYMGIRAVQKGLNDGEWHQIAVVRSKGTLSLYIDGDFSIYGANKVPTNINSRNPLKLGRSLVDRRTRRFAPKALFDDVAIYYRALSYKQVKQLYDDTNV